MYAQHVYLLPSILEIIDEQREYDLWCLLEAQL